MKRLFALGASSTNVSIIIAQSKLFAAAVVLLQAYSPVTAQHLQSLTALYYPSSCNSLPFHSLHLLANTIDVIVLI